MTFQFHNPAPVLWTLNALAPAAGGSIQFYAIGTTTPKATYADFAKTTPNANPVPLDSAGRPETPIWLDGDYSVTVRDSAGTTIDTFDLRDPATGGTTIPPLVSGQFLTNNSTALIWQAIRQLPDPTGQAGKVVTTDGANYLFTNLPTPPAPDISVGSNIFKARGNTSTPYFCVQTGSGSAAASNAPSASASVTFPTAFTGLWYVGVMATSSTVTGSQTPVVGNVTSSSATGFTVIFDPAEGTNGQKNVINAVPFTWFALGTTAS